MVKQMFWVNDWKRGVSEAELTYIGEQDYEWYNEEHDTYLTPGIDMFDSREELVEYQIKSLEDYIKSLNEELEEWKTKR